MGDGVMGARDTLKGRLMSSAKPIANPSSDEDTFILPVLVVETLRTTQMVYTSAHLRFIVWTVFFVRFTGYEYVGIGTMGMVSTASRRLLWGCLVPSCALVVAR
jgi:hypothetical protein